MLVLDVKNFDSIVLEEKNRPVLVEFWAPWCGYCQRLAPTFAAVADAYENQLVIGKVNIDDAMELAETYQVEIIPSLLLFEKGQLVRRVVNPPDKKAIEAFLQAQTAEVPSTDMKLSDNKKAAGKETAAYAPQLSDEELQALDAMPIYGYALEKPDGELQQLSEYKGRVLLIVNTATGCGFTPQYKQLEELYVKYRAQGLEIIDIPCNQFAGQAPGSDEEIHQFCTVKFGTTFPRMKKAEVNGPNALPLYGYLKAQKQFTGFGNSLKGMAMAAMLKLKDFNYQNSPDIKWNFTKFLVDRRGNVAARFEPTADMAEVAKAVAELVARP